jgi:uncharacterized protein (DUF697 family)
MDLTSEAARVIDKFAVLHLKTAFIAGQFGGQFGLDRIPLTALTITMIISICDLYNIKDNKAKAIHVLSAIGRLTFRGTVIAQTMVNWIPIAGPLANSIVTYVLTKRAGWDCVNDIRKNRMNVKDQMEYAIRRGTVVVAGDTISDVSGAISSDVIEDLIVDTNIVVQTTEALSEVFTEILNDETLIGAEKVLLSSIISGMSRDIIENKTRTFREYIWNGLMMGIAAGVYGDELKTQDFELPHEDKIRLMELIAKREAHPGLFSTFVDLQISALEAASSRGERLKTINILIKAIEEGTELVKAAKAGKEV